MGKESGVSEAASMENPNGQNVVIADNTNAAADDAVIADNTNAAADDAVIADNTNAVADDAVIADNTNAAADDAVVEYVLRPEDEVSYFSEIPRDHQDYASRVIVINATQQKHNSHQQAHCNIEQSGDSSKSSHYSNRYACQYCGKRFHLELTLISHELWHKEAHKRAQVAVSCKICHKTLSSKISLRSHMRTHGDRPYLCDLCGFRSDHQHALIAHRRAIHMGERPYECSSCEQRFASGGQLKNHKDVHHSLNREKKYICEVCAKSY